MTSFYSQKSKVLMISTSKIHGSLYMEYLLSELKEYLSSVTELLFIPYARPGGISYDDYTNYPSKALASIGVKVKGIHQFSDPVAAIRQAEAVFVGGGNTFLLLKTLYDMQLLEPLRVAVASGTPYLGSSAGSNITGLSVGTTNDMPIVYPPSFEALALVPFNINPHYLDPAPESKHQGETRATRINEFHSQNPQPVIGLREGSWLRLEQGRLSLRGNLNAPLFEAGQETREIPPGDVSFLLEG
jgi:dipeptidase E